MWSSTCGGLSIRLRDAHGDRGWVETASITGGGHVGTALPDGWQDLPGDSALEGAGLRFVRAHHEPVEAWFRDDQRVPAPLHVIQSDLCGGDVLGIQLLADSSREDAKRVADVLDDKPGAALDVERIRGQLGVVRRTLDGAVRWLDRIASTGFPLASAA